MLSENGQHPNWPAWLNWLLAALAFVVVVGARIREVGKWIAGIWRFFVKRFNAIPDLTEALTKLSNSFEALVKVTESRFADVDEKLKCHRYHTAIAHAQAALILDEDLTPRFRCRLPEGTCEWVNPALAELFGKTSEEMLVWEWLSAVHPDDIQRVQSEWLEAIRTMRPYRTRYRILVDDEPLTVEATGTIIHDTHHEAIAVLGKVMPLPVHT